MEQLEPKKDAITIKSRSAHANWNTPWLNTFWACICSKEVERRTFVFVVIGCVLELIYFGANLQSSLDALAVQKESLEVQVQSENDGSQLAFMEFRKRCRVPNVSIVKLIYSFDSLSDKSYS